MPLSPRQLLRIEPLAILYTLLALIATFQHIKLGDAHSNNFWIFRGSYAVLQRGEDLYAPHPDLYKDLFKYSPTFALLMAPFYYLPGPLALFLWNLLNVLAPLYAIHRLRLSFAAKAFVLLYILLELLTSIQNAQSNGLMVGLIIGTFAAFESNQPILAAAFTCLGFYLKVFGGVVGILFLFYPRKPVYLLACAVWVAALGASPLLVTSIDNFGMQYRSWLHLLGTDRVHDLNYSIMSLTQRWFNFEAPDKYYLVPGLALMLIPLIRYRHWGAFAFRLLFLASLLVWVVIFNRKAESPTYVIAMAGVALWALTEPNSILRYTLLAFAFLLTSLGPTDLFPKSFKAGFWQPLCLKALPPIVIWFTILFRLLTQKTFSLSFLAETTSPPPPNPLPNS
jgi:hypothetical protein